MKNTRPKSPEPESSTVSAHVPPDRRRSLLLSCEGSDRATAYNISNKLIRHGEYLFAGWLDAPAQPGGPTRARIGIHDNTTMALRHGELIGEAEDNHCGPALALDRDGCLHAVIGSHGHAFQYRYSRYDEQKSDPFAWSPPELLGPADTYPSLIADASGTLHLLSRASGERWTLLYRRKRSGSGSAWEPARTLAVSPVAGYNNFMHTISTGPDGVLHVLFQFHHGTPTSSVPADLLGRLAVYLVSHDGGDTWFDDAGKRCALPITAENACPFLHPQQPGLRISNHVVDVEDRPWIFTTMPERRAGALFRRGTDGVWAEIDTSKTLGRFNFQDGHGREVSLSRDASGRIHLVAATNPDGASAAWYDPRHELFHLVLDEITGGTLSFAQISPADPTVAHWLPALENWDWTRRTTCCANAPWLLYTRGANLGGIGGNNANSLRTEVFLHDLRA